MSSRFITGLHVMELADAYGAKFMLRGYPGSMRDWRGKPMIVDGLPFDYKENNNVGEKGTSSDSSGPEGVR